MRTPIVNNSNIFYPIIALFQIFDFVNFNKNPIFG